MNLLPESSLVVRRESTLVLSSFILSFVEEIFCNAADRFILPDDVRRRIRNVKFSNQGFLLHALFCNICDRNFFFIFTQVEMAEE